MSVDDLLTQSRSATESGDHRQGAEGAETALNHPDATPDNQAKARELLALHRLRLGDYQDCVQQGLQALEFFTANGDLLAQSRVHCTLALAFTDTALNETALRHVLGALEAARACGNPTAEFWALSRFSLVRGAMGDDARSIDLGRQALAVAQTLHDPETSFVAVNNLGDTYLVMAREAVNRGDDPTQPFTDALVLMREAVALAQSQVNPFNEALARTNMVGIGTSGEAARRDSAHDRADGRVAVSDAHQHHRDRARPPRGGEVPTGTAGGTAPGRRTR
ncbi:hypothetical protein [Cryobacterium psychrophilum]|uniref:hypothetical protein n=1 Tax=Cryobacterium psychrophilum TaxID=41988 RepID=UPI001416FCB8|nr:hypothetical protein [Cryobacterium psychrophilum]